MEESDHGLQLGRVERRDAGLELGLEVVLHDAHVSYPHREHVLVQGVHQRKELVQVLVLEEGLEEWSEERRENIEKKNKTQPGSDSSVLPAHTVRAMK